MNINPLLIEPGQEWEVDLFRPEDAPGVIALFRTVYGDGYPVKTFTDPERLIAENAARRTISSVARTKKGDIVGHCSIFNSTPYNGLYESGAGLVLPLYRGGKGVSTRMMEHGVEMARKFGLTAVWGEPVCNHVFQQKAVLKLGAKTHGVEVDLMPASAYAQEKSSSGRVSVLVDFISNLKKPHRVFLPKIYEEIMRFIYDGSEEKREMLISREILPASPGTEVKVQVFDFAQVARLALHEAGADLSAVIGAQEEGLRARGVIVFQIWLKLSWPYIGGAVEALRGRGYFFGAVLPRWFDEDGMLMQRIIGRPNWEGIQIYSDRAKKVLELVKADWKQINKPV